MEGIIVFIIIAWLIPKLIKGIKGKEDKNANKGNNAARPAAAPRQTPSVQMNRPAPAMKRPPVRNPAHRDYSAPEAPCIVCEQTGEDHFQRDKIRRLAQLDEWLKIGLIDRDEYRVMKDRYQRGI